MEKEVDVESLAKVLLVVSSWENQFSLRMLPLVNCPFFQDYEQRSFIQDYGHHKSDLIGLKKEENENLEQNGSGGVERGRANITEVHCTTFTKLIKRQKNQNVKYLPCI